MRSGDQRGADWREVFPQHAYPRSMAKKGRDQGARLSGDLEDWQAPTISIVREQLCQQGIALCQVLFDFTIALSTVSSFRMQAVMATLGCLPAARSRSWNARISGLQRIALIVAM